MGLYIRRVPSRKVQLITTLVAVLMLVSQPLYGFMATRIAHALPDTLSPPTLISPGDGIPVKGNGGLVNDWSDVSGVLSYTYQSFNLNPEGECNYSDERGSDMTYTSSQTGDLNIPDDSLTFCWRVKAVGGLGESDWSSTWKTVVDNKAPDVSIAPIGTVGGNTLTIYGNATDNVELAGYTYRVLDSNHAALGENAMTAPVRGGVLGAWDISGLASGTYYAQVVATDRAGNSLPAPYETSFIIDHTAPSVTAQLASPTHPMASTDQISLAGHVYGDFHSLKLMRDGDASTAVDLTADADGNWTFAIPKENVVQGAYNFSVIATDAYGNESMPAGVAVVASAYIPGGGTALSTGALSSPAPSFTILNSVVGGATQPFTEAEPQIKPDNAVLRVEDAGGPVAQSSDTPVVTATESGWKFFGIAWYWWGLMTLLVMGGIWVTATNVRSREGQFA